MSKDLLMRLALFGSRLFYAYSLLIWIRIILSWFTGYPQRNSFTYYIARMVDPYLKVFQGKKGTNVGRLDFSPIFAIGVIFIFESVLNIFGSYGFLSVAIITQIFIYAFWNYGLSIYFWVLFIALVFKTIASFSRSSAMWNASAQIGAAANPVTDFVRSFLKNGIMNERTVNLISLALTAVMWFVCKYLVNYLIGLTVHIPF